MASRSSLLIDYWGAFSDFGRADEDQDLGAAGVVLIPERGNLIGGGKDGILYNLNKDDLGQNDWSKHFNLPFVATYLPNAPYSRGGSPGDDGARSGTGRSSNSIATSPHRHPTGRPITFTERPCTWSWRRAGSLLCLG